VDKKAKSWRERREDEKNSSETKLMLVVIESHNWQAIPLGGAVAEKLYLSLNSTYKFMLDASQIVIVDDQKTIQFGSFALRKYNLEKKHSAQVVALELVALASSQTRLHAAHCARTEQRESFTAIVSANCV